MAKTLERIPPPLELADPDGYTLVCDALLK